MTSRHTLLALGLSFVLATGIVVWDSTQAGEAGNSSTVDTQEWKKTQWEYQGAPPTALEEAERVVTEEELPGPALSALRSAAGEYELEAFEEEIRGSKTLYEGEWRVGNHTEEATVTSDGVLIETEATVSAEQVPETVRNAAEKLAGGAPAAFSRRQFIFYEVEYTVDGKEREVLLSPSGLVVGSEMPGDAAAN